MSAAADTTTTTHPRWPGLDGVRALAIALVILTHLGEGGPELLERLTRGGIVGVDVFFVLSGFLITSILVAEWDTTGSIELGRFYMRRALRLFPALLLMVAVVSLAAVTFLPAAYRAPTLTGVPYTLFYVYDLRWLLPGAAPLHAGLMDKMWSLSVEEQFYLVWPSVLLLALTFVPNARRVRVLQLALAAAALVELHRMLLFLHGGALWNRLYWSPDTHTDGLLLGCALAFAMGRWSPSRRTLRVAGSAGLLGILVATLWFAPGSPLQARRYLEFNVFGVAALASALLIWSVVAGSAPTIVQRGLESRPARYVGRISYGLYLWNYAVFVALPLRGMPWLLAAAIRTAILFAVAAASFHFVERHFLRIKSRRWSSEAPAARATASATVG